MPASTTLISPTQLHKVVFSWVKHRVKITRLYRDDHHRDEWALQSRESVLDYQAEHVMAGYFAKGYKRS